jgi:hypothetical protein
MKKCIIPHASSPGLSDTPFQHLNLLEEWNDPGEPEKYTNTEINLLLLIKRGTK